MAISSMTAFTRCEKSFEKINLSVEIRSVNNRYIDVKVSQPSAYNSFYNNIVKLINKEFSRGAFGISIRREVTSEEYLKLDYNKVQADKYVDLLKEIKSNYNIKEDIVLSDILSSSAVSFQTDLTEDDLKYEWGCLEDILGDAVASMKKMRETEGAHLWKDIHGRLTFISDEVGKIEKDFAGVLKDYQSRVQDRLDKVLKQVSKGLSIDPTDPRFLQEIGYISDRCDITEEFTRLKAHLEEFFKFEKVKVSVGRKMDFLLQEMNREINTIGSKNIDTSLGLQVIEIKSEVEKIRQQVQNIE